MTRRLPIYLIFLALVLAAMYLIIWGVPRLPIDMADGTYANACCDDLVLKHGRMSTREWSTSYVIEADKGGAYVLPRHYVGVVANQGIALQSDLGPLKLRLNDTQHPTKIEVIDDDRGLAFPFERRN